MRRLSVCVITCAGMLIVAGSGCGGSDTAPAPLASGNPVEQESIHSWPVMLPADAAQPWEALDSRGYVVPQSRSLSYINADSIFVPGVERYAESGANVSDNGEAARLTSGDAGEGRLSWADWRLTMAGEQLGAVSADVNLLPMSDGAQSEYYLGLSDYAAGVWEWRGPFSESHVRLSVPAGNYLSDLGNLFVCIVACDGAKFDVVGVASNPRDAGDSTAPPAPANLTVTAITGGLELSWDASSAADLAGYRVYYSAASFVDGSGTGVRSLPDLEGTTYRLLPAEQETYVRVSAVDVSGNESALSAIASATPLAGTLPAVQLGASQPSGLLGETITLSADGAEIYDWDLDGDGVFELSGDASGSQEVATGQPGLIRPAVRGLLGAGSTRACGGVSVLIGSNSRPLATAYAEPAFGPAPLSVTFTGTGEDDDGTITGYAWDFDGDGTYDYEDATEPNPPVQEFSTPGMYNAKFRVEDNLGLTDVDTIAISVTEPDNIAPSASLGVGPGEEEGEAPHLVHFDASASGDPDGVIIEFLWDFDGDGHIDFSSEEATVIHEYPPGSFNPAVRVVDDDFARDTATIAITSHGWAIVTVDNAAIVGDLPCLAVVDGSPAISYRDESTWDLKYARATTGTGVGADEWTQIVTVDGPHDVGYYSTLLVVDGRPAIAYHDNTDLKLKYVRASTSTGGNPADWSNVLTVADSGYYSSMAIVDGNPGIAHSYSDGFTSTLRYVRSTTSGGDDVADWSQLVTVDAASNVSMQVSLAVVAGCPAIAYYDADNDDLKYARAITSTGKEATDWTQVFKVADVGSSDAWKSLAVIGGNPAIAYCDTSLYYLRSTTSTGGSASDWTQLVTVEAAGDLCSLALIDGRPAISYWFPTDDELRFVHATTGTGSGGGDWSDIDTVDSDGSVGWGTSLQVVAGRPAIAYYDYSNTALKYAIGF